MARLQLLAIFLIAIIVSTHAAHQDKDKEKPKKEIKETPNKAKDSKAMKTKDAEPKNTDSHKHEEGANANETRHDQWRGPPFLANATEEVRADFKKIIDDKTLNSTAKDGAIAALMAKQSADLQDAYSKFQAEHAAKVAALSPEAKTAYNSIQTIKDDTTLDEGTKKTKVKAIKKGLSSAVRQELKDLKAHYKGHKKCERKDGDHKKHQEDSSEEATADAPN